MVSRQEEKLFALICGHYSTAVADVSNEALFTDNKYYDTTAATPFVHRSLSICIVDESFFSFKAACGQCLGWVLWKTLLVDNYKVQLIF